jgi:hypothetical protein
MTEEPRPEFEIGQIVHWPSGEPIPADELPAVEPLVVTQRFKGRWWMRPRSWWMMRNRYWFNPDYWEEVPD